MMEKMTKPANILVQMFPIPTIKESLSKRIMYLKVILNTIQLIKTKCFMISWSKRRLGSVVLKRWDNCLSRQSYLTDLPRSWYMLGKYLLEAVVVKLIVTRQCNKTTPCWTEGKEDLSSSIWPHLNQSILLLNYSQSFYQNNINIIITLLNIT